MKKTLLSIFGGVATAILIVIIKHYLFAPPPPPRPSISVDGQVFDKTGSHVLEKVVVRIHVEAKDETQDSDSLGRYLFLLDGFKTSATGFIEAQAPGYRTATYNLAVQDQAIHHDIYLEEIPPPTNPPPGNPTGNPPGNLAVVGHLAAASRYVARPDFKRLAEVPRK